jgi:glycosyl transferase, family 25
MGACPDLRSTLAMEEHSTRSSGGLVQAFIIGLEDQYRGEELEKSLSSVGLDYRKSKGVSGSFNSKPMKELANQKLAKALHGATLLDGEIGCAIAHLSVYEKFLKSKREWGLVLEDDARVVDGSALSQVLEKLDTLREGNPTIYLLFGAGILSSGRFHEVVPGYLAWDLLITPGGSSGYVINRSAAQMILEQSLPIISPADWPLRTEGRITFRAVLPWPLGNLGENHSLIGERNIGATARFEGLSTTKYPSIFTALRLLARVPRGEFRVFWSSAAVRFLVRKSMGQDWQYQTGAAHNEPPVANLATVTLVRILGGRRKGLGNSNQRSKRSGK